MAPARPVERCIYDRKTPEFDDTSWNLNATTGVSTWSDTPDFDLDAAAGFGNWSLRALGTYRNTNNYDDGSGEEVRSAAKSAGGTLMVGWRPERRHRVRVEL